MLFPDDFKLFTPEALATYIVGAVAVVAGIYQLRRNLRLNKNSKV